MTPNEKRLVARLPVVAATAVKELLSLDDIYAARKVAWAAADAVGYPEYDELIPLPSGLSPEQRALVEIFAHHDVDVVAYAMPVSAWNRRRWLGLDAPGVLEKMHRGEPLWRALQKARGPTWPRPDFAAERKILDRLPMPARLAAYCEIGVGAYRLGLFDDPAFTGSAKLRNEGKRWAPGFATWLLELVAKKELGRIRRPVKWPLFVSLVRSKIPIRPEWDVLLPLSEDALALSVECAGAIPSERRSSAIRGALRDAHLGEAVEILLGLLPHFPDPALVPLLHEKIEFSTRPRKKILAQLAAIAKKRPGLCAYVGRSKAAAPRIVLTCQRLPRPKRPTPLQKRQLAPIVADEPDLQLRQVRFYTLTDGGKKSYDALLLRGEDGYVYRAGTTKRVGSVAQGGVDECRDRELAAAIDEAFATLNER